jgi:hypothetical protein
LGEIQADIHEFRRTVLLRFDETEQKIVKIFISHLNYTQIQITQDIIDALEDQRLLKKNHREIENIAKKMFNMLTEIQHSISTERKDLMDAIKTFTELQKSAEYNARHRLILTLWLIPGILSYQAIHESEAGIKIQKLWERLKTIWTKISEKSS